MGQQASLESTCGGRYHRRMTAEEQSELRAFFDDELRLSDAELDARDDRWAESSATEAIREEPWRSPSVEPLDAYGTTWGTSSMM